MADFLSELASKAGLDGDQVHRGVGAVLAMLKERLDPAMFAHLQKAIPNSEDMLARCEDTTESAGDGVLAAVKSMAGKLLGGGEQDIAATLANRCASVGLTPEHLQSLLPKLHEMLAAKLPPHVLDQIKEHIPASGGTADAEPPEESDR
jgi:hypothetical protein